MKKLLIVIYVCLLTSPIVAGTVTVIPQPPHPIDYQAIGDVDRDGTVGALDIDALFDLFGPTVDFIPDGEIDINDVDFLVREVFFTTYGDANLDRKVDMTDFDITFAHFGLDAGWSGGDFNSDDIVDIEDLGFVFGNFGFGRDTSIPAIEAVPEPSTMILMIVGVVSIVFVVARRAK